MKFLQKVYSKTRKSLSLVTLVCLMAFSANINVYASDNVVDEAKSIINNYYVNEVSENKLNKGTIEEIVKGLEDPYSQYFTKNQYQDFINSIDYKYCGLGIRIELAKEGIKVNEIFDGSPALDAGLKVGDIIVQVETHDLKGVSLDEVSGYLKGEEGTSIKILVKRGEELKNYIVKRKLISAPTVESKIIDSGIGYLKIGSFGAETPALFTKKLQELQTKNPNSYIIDLRNNTGGYLTAALDIAGHFIGNNTVMLIETRGGEKEKLLGYKHSEMINKPTMILINEDTASASEILSGAIKDYNKAFFIGNTTYGKGVAQNSFNLSDGSVIKLTTEKFYTPFAHNINKIGIAPDLKVVGANINQLKLAELLLGENPKNLDKRGVIRVKIDSERLYIDINKAKNKEYINEFNYIMGKVDLQNIYLGVEKGWENTTKDNIINLLK